MMKASGVSLMPAWPPPPSGLASFLHRRDVRFVDLRDVRQVHPARLQSRPGNLLDAAERLELDRAELRKIDARDLGQSAVATAPAAAPLVRPA